MATPRLVKAHERLPEGSAYELLVWLAAGGMGTVYVARKKNARIGRLYALKRTHPHLLEDQDFSASVAREGWLASRIQHPNVVAMHDVEELTGECLLVMDYVDGISGETIGARTTGAGSFVPAIVRIIHDVAAGLHAAHGLVDQHGRPLNVVHRDVSPHNILIGADGITRVADFGLAKAASNLSSRTASGVLQGKAGYMAPEYIASGKLDARSDIFALGIVAWELLCARRMFVRSNDAATLHAIMHQKATPPSQVAPELEWADESVLTALQIDPDRRYPTAQAFAQAFLEAARRWNVVGDSSDVSAFVRDLAEPHLEAKRQLLREAGRVLDGVEAPPPVVNEAHTVSLAGDEL